MQSNWEAEHSEALRGYLAEGMSFSEATDAINSKFRAAYSRSAVIGRSKRMGLASADRPGGSVHWLKRPPKTSAQRIQQPRERHVPEFMKPMPVFERVEAPLRCVELVPRHLSLVDLEPGDCRYPYGGDEEGEAITFCGHSRRRRSSYCSPHFHLTRGCGVPSEEAVGTILPQPVEMT